MKAGFWFSHLIVTFTLLEPVMVLRFYYQWWVGWANSHVDRWTHNTREFSAWNGFRVLFGACLL